MLLYLLICSWRYFPFVITDIFMTSSLIKTAFHLNPKPVPFDMTHNPILEFPAILKQVISRRPIGTLHNSPAPSAGFGSVKMAPRPERTPQGVRASRPHQPWKAKDPRIRSFLSPPMTMVGGTPTLLEAAILTQSRHIVPGSYERSLRDPNQSHSFSLKPFSGSLI